MKRSATLGVLFLGMVFGGGKAALADSYSFTTVNVPGASDTIAYGINNSGQVVGYFGDGSGFHGFVDTGGVFSTINDPSATASTLAHGINSSAQVVGSFVDGIANRGFVDTGGVFSTINDPSAPGQTSAQGVNDGGQVAGYFYDGTADHGFVATPIATPEPGTLTLLGCGLIGLAALYRRKLAVGESELRPNCSDLRSGKIAKP